MPIDKEELVVAIEYVSAIFLDFDNIFGALWREDPGIADQFAKSPALWLGAMTSMSGNEGDEVLHRWVVRRCYMNPSGRIYPKAGAPSEWFSKYRQNFVRDGWEVIDTPPLTGGGKTSADIHIVMDVLDTVSIYSHVNEYMIMAADADYTPLVIRLRKYLKRTVIYYADEQTSAAYRACCDSELPQQAIIDLYRTPANDAVADQNIGKMTSENAVEVVRRYFAESGQGFSSNAGLIGHMLVKLGFDARESDFGSVTNFLRSACGLVVEAGPNGKVYLPFKENMSQLAPEN